VRNVVFIKVELEEGDKPLSDTPLVATFTLMAAHTNTQAMTLSDGKGVEIPVPAGTQLPFEQVNLADIFVRSKGGEVAFVVGHTAG
jgi:hypothetical protein